MLSYYTTQEKAAEKGLVFCSVFAKSSPDAEIKVKEIINKGYKAFIVPVPNFKNLQSVWTEQKYLDDEELKRITNSCAQHEKLLEIFENELKEHQKNYAEKINRENLDNQRRLKRIEELKNKVY